MKKSELLEMFKGEDRSRIEIQESRDWFAGAAKNASEHALSISKGISIQKERRVVRWQYSPLPASKAK